MALQPKLSAEDLLTRGYFHDRVIPPLNSLGLLPALPELKALTKNTPNKRSRCTRHSVPKRKHLRRSLAIPNPLHQTALSLDVEKCWTKLLAACTKSHISLSVPKLSSERALETAYSINALPVQRSLRSVGSRYVVKTDLARFYPSIYTHSVAWALHGKAKARANKSLFGNSLDRCLSDTQDKQTGGIPIGPDTSFLIGEVMGSAIDAKLQDSIVLRGTRYIDDYCLYFQDQSEAEKALALLHKVAKEFELEVNDPKTDIAPLPEELEPSWKTELRGMHIRDVGQPQVTDLLSLFNRGFDLANKFPSDNVLTYVARQVSSSTIDPENWELCEALLMKAALAEPTALSVIIEILQNNSGAISNKANLAEAVWSLCNYHAPLEQGYEVAWALWLAKRQKIDIDPSVAKKVAMMDDDIVALVALNLRALGLFPTVSMAVWRKAMDPQHLYSEHWLLSYEALEQGWLTAKSDYVAADPVFSVLRKHHVRFYDSGIMLPVPSSTGYDEPEGEVERGTLTPEHLLISGRGTSSGVRPDARTPAARYWRVTRAVTSKPGREHRRARLARESRRSWMQWQICSI